MKKIIPLLVAISLLPACGPASGLPEQECSGSACSEADINAPVPGTEPVPSAPVADPLPPPDDKQGGTPGGRLPSFDPSWQMKASVYDAASRYFADNHRDFSNQRYVTIVDMSQHSSQRRLYLFDLTTGEVTRFLTSHGKNSDPDGDGYATLFSNESGSLKSSLGAYRTLSTYTGSNGYSLRLSGLESTNSNAYERAIVIHPAEYVQEETPYAGRSWGCPALDPEISRGLIEKIKEGSFLYIGR